MSESPHEPRVSALAVVLQIAGGMFVFLIVFTPAVILDVAITQLSSSHAVSALLMGVMKAAKYVLLVIDCVVGVLFLVAHLLKFARSIWDEMREACR